MVRKDDIGGGSWDPGTVLEFAPVPKDAVPTTFDEVLGYASWTSLGHWALKVLDLADGSFDLVDKCETWIVGDWQDVAIAAAAMGELSAYCTKMADAVDFYSSQLDSHWDGMAAQVAQLNFATQTYAFREAAEKLEYAQRGYEDVANGIYGTAQDVGSLAEFLIDCLIAAGVSAAAGAGTWWTGIGPVIGGLATGAAIYEIVQSIQKITTMLEGATQFVDALTDVVYGFLGAAGDFRKVVTIPSPYDNDVVPA